MVVSCIGMLIGGVSPIRWFAGLSSGQRGTADRKAATPDGRMVEVRAGDQGLSSRCHPKDRNVLTVESLNSSGGAGVTFRQHRASHPGVDRV